MIDATSDPSEIEAARRDGYQRGLGVGLFWMGAFFAVYTAGWTMTETPKFRDVFAQVKVPMPALTVLLVENYAVAAAVLLLATAVAAVLTFSRKLSGKAVIRVNGLLFVLAMGWSALSTVAVKAPLLSLFQGLGTGR
jgi:hypothetical protein